MMRSDGISWVIWTGGDAVADWLPGVACCQRHLSGSDTRQGEVKGEEIGCRESDTLS
jgi:hypothetical protein